MFSFFFQLTIIQFGFKINRRPKKKTLKYWLHFLFVGWLNYSPLREKKSFFFCWKNKNLDGILFSLHLIPQKAQILYPYFDYCFVFARHNVNLLKLHSCKIVFWYDYVLFVERGIRMQKKSLITVCHLLYSLKGREKRKYHFFFFCVFFSVGGLVKKYWSQ